MIEQTDIERALERIEAIRRELNILTALLRDDSAPRPVRPYDLDTPPAEEVAAAHGVDLTDPAGTPPRWWCERFGHHLEGAGR